MFIGIHLVKLVKATNKQTGASKNFTYTVVYNNPVGRVMEEEHTTAKLDALFNGTRTLRMCEEHHQHAILKHGKWLPISECEYDKQLGEWSKRKESFQPQA
jgi:hypothetical protein